jgi:DNA-binding Lrp family transcriptional regulator
MMLSVVRVRPSIGGVANKSKTCAKFLVTGAVFVPVSPKPLFSEKTMTTCVFVQLRCKPGTTYDVAEAIIQREIHSELHSTSGDYDLLMKMYIPEGEDVGMYINRHLLDVAGIERSLTTLTFKAF